MNMFLLLIEIVLVVCFALLVYVMIRDKKTKLADSTLNKEAAEIAEKTEKDEEHELYFYQSMVTDEEIKEEIKNEEKNSGLSPALIAAIMASVALMLDKPVGEIRYTSIKRTNGEQTAWSVLGTSDLMSNRQRLTERGIRS